MFSISPYSDIFGFALILQLHSCQSPKKVKKKKKSVSPPNVRRIYYMVHVIIGLCGRYEVRVHNWSPHPWQVQLTGVREGGPSSLPPLHAAQREKGRSVNECTPESHHLLPPPKKKKKKTAILSDRDMLRPVFPTRRGGQREGKNFLVHRSALICSFGVFFPHLFFFVFLS